LNGLLWGLIGAELLAEGRPELTLLGTMLLGAVAVGALPSLGALFPVYVIYLSGVLAPSAVAFALRGDGPGAVLAGLALAYGTFLVVLARRFHVRVIESTRIAIERAELARELAVTRTRSDRTAFRLENEIRERQRVEEELAHLTTHDALTGLVNRRGFDETVRAAMQRSGAHSAVMFLDIDRFTLINDASSHSVGDELLCRVGALLLASVRKHDVVGRLGGDQFGVFLESCPLDEAASVAETLRSRIERERFIRDGRTFTITASIGVAAATAGAEDFERVLAAADSACHAAKDLGRNRVQIYDAEDVTMVQRSREMHWASQIPEALAEGRLFLLRQRIVPAESAPDGEWYEVLLRMRDRAGRVVPPGTFMASAERYNLAVALDLWVVQTVLGHLAADPGHREGLGRCFINLSGQSLGSPAFVERLAELVAGSAVAAGRI
jgi:diguanylate cyclase (GGDEF)-like protein